MAIFKRHQKRVEIDTINAKQEKIAGELRRSRLPAGDPRREQKYAKNASLGQRKYQLYKRIRGRE